MKEVIAIIRMNKINATKKALADIGIYGMHAMKVMGRGKVHLDLKVLDGMGPPEEIGGIVMDGVAGGARLIPKRMITVLVQDEDVDKVVAAIIDNNREGNMGDGKIFVCPVHDVCRIRTGERGEAAI
ncbi:MAG: P-II family nitrogen regulator [Firmicutes bacterium]|nr:P-II family nitrogen regulator [Bacillota bacterium]